jgi:hypothetical protein
MCAALLLPGDLSRVLMRTPLAVSAKVTPRARTRATSPLPAYQPRLPTLA